VTYAAPATDETAVLGRRFVAFLIDLALVWGIAIAFAVPAFNSNAQTLPASQYECATSGEGTDFRIDVTSSICVELGDEIRFVPDGDSGSVTGVFYGVLAAVFAANHILLQGVTGGTIGKLLLGLRVVRQDTGQIAGILKCFIRGLVSIVDFACCYLIGGIMVLATKGHRRLGDMAGGTLVVSAKSVGHPPSVPGLTTGYGTPAYGAQPGYGAPGYPPPGGQAPGWGVPPAQGTWAPPATGPGAPPAGPAGPVSGGPAPTDPAAGGGDGPIWDEARNTYIQYDTNVGAWLQWDDQTNAWKPIDQ